MSYQSELIQRYNAISERSFKSKLDIYLFRAITEKGCLNDVTLKDFTNYNVTQKWLKLYEEAWQVKEGRFPITSKVTLKELDTIIESWLKKEIDLVNILKNNYIKHFQKHQLSIEEFKVLYPINTDDRKCYYCKTSENELNQLRDKKLIRTKSYRGDKLEIDRKEPNEEYYYDNLVLSCYWCNNAKTDEFSAGEFEIIGESIKSIWSSRNSKNNNHE